MINDCELFTAAHTLIEIKSIQFVKARVSSDSTNFSIEIYFNRMILLNKHLNTDIITMNECNAYGFNNNHFRTETPI